VFDRETIDATVSDIAFSPDSTQFIISDFDGNLQMWDIETGVRTSFIRGEGVSISNRINALAFSPDGETVATAESDPQGVIRIYHRVNLRQKAAFSGGRLAEAARDVAFNPDGTLLAAIFDDTVRIVETTDYTQVAELVAGRN
jgi:WD40 repeat protein